MKNRRRKRTEIFCSLPDAWRRLAASPKRVRVTSRVGKKRLEEPPAPSRKCVTYCVTLAEKLRGLKLSLRPWQLPNPGFAFSKLSAIRAREGF